MSGNHEPGLSDADDVARSLTENPPTLDDVARARMEKQLLDAIRDPSRSAREVRATGRSRSWLIAGGFAAAAAAALGFFALRSPEVEGRQARMELRNVGSTLQTGTIDEGSSLRTSADEVADIRIEDSLVHLEPSTELQIAALTSERMVFELRSGEVRVEFHPRARGQEHMTVRTSRATVEVVGTVFTVRETATYSDVSVDEGRVRVVPRDGEPRSVGAGESTRVGPEPHASVTPAATDDEAVPAAVEAPEPATEIQAEPLTARERHSQSPAQRLSRVRRLIRDGELEVAEALVRGVTSAPDASARTRAQAFTYLGDLLRRRASLQEAAQAYQSAASLGAGQVSHMAVYALARMQERRMGDSAAARASYRRYIDEAGSAPLVGQARAALCRLGEVDMCGAAAGFETATPDEATP